MVKGKSRLVSLDIFRGVTVAFMIIVNTPGSWQYVYSPLRHAKWQGCTPTDMVFPLFLFIVGVSTYYSLKKYGHEINSNSLLRIFRRVVTLFALGLFLNIFPNFGMDYSKLRIMGVLQRIALAYGIGTIICLSVRRQYLWIVIAFILLIYWGLLAAFGGADPFGLESNFVLKTDIAILGKSHLYSGFGVPFDPEGLLSTFPSVCTVMIGFLAGGMIGKGLSSGDMVLKLILYGVGLTGLGYLWNLIFPFIKPLWTSSFVLFTAGIAMICLAVIYLVADVLKLRKWAIFFLVFGTNALFAFFLSGTWTKLMLYLKIPSGNETMTLYSWFYQKICIPVAGNLNGSFLFAVMQMLLIWAISLILYRKKIMIRL